MVIMLEALSCEIQAGIVFASFGDVVNNNIQAPLLNLR